MTAAYLRMDYPRRIRQPLVVLERYRQLGHATGVILSFGKCLPVSILSNSDVLPPVGVYQQSELIKRGYYLQLMLDLRGGWPHASQSGSNR